LTSPEGGAADQHVLNTHSHYNALIEDNGFMKVSAAVSSKFDQLNQNCLVNNNNTVVNKAKRV